MSCFFCGSFNHLSHNCNIYVSDESRQNIAETNGCCSVCFTYLPKRRRYHDCLKKQKCYTCFSENHHTFLCHDKNLLAPHIFLPAIDEDLIARFMDIIDFEEQVAITFLFPNTALIKPQDLTVIEENEFDVKYCVDTNLLITDYLNLTVFHHLPHMESIIFKGKSILFQQIGNFYPEEFLQLLSPKLKILRCIDVGLIEGVNFEEILKNAPNLEVIDLNGINIAVKDSWPEDILKWKIGNNLTTLTISIQNADFNVKSFITVLKEKSKKAVMIALNASDSITIKKKLHPCFDRVNKPFNVRGTVIINGQYFALKTKF